eukprot:2454351-Pyramimonas_sp.AAC.1
MEDRAAVWGQLGAGMMHTIEAYRVFIASVIAFIAQLDPLPDGFPEFEKRVLRKLFPGPCDWIPGDILRALTTFGFPRNFPDVQAIANVAKVRVALHEAHSSVGLRALPRATALRETMHDLDSIRRLGARWAWAASSFLLSLEAAVLSFPASGDSARLLLDPSAEESRREGWQARALRATQPTYAIAAERALWRPLDHWRLVTLPGRRCQRLLRALGSIKALVPPRVLAA